jgi:hypothetical protein
LAIFLGEDHDDNGDRVTMAATSWGTSPFIIPGERVTSVIDKFMFLICPNIIIVSVCAS